MYVSEEIGGGYKNWKDGDIILLTAPTGTGKTTFILEKLLPYVMQKNGRLLYLVNRKVLREQLIAELKKIKNRYLVDVGGASSINRFISIETYQYYEQKLLSLNPLQVVREMNTFSLVVYDECHYFYADSSFNTYTELSYDFFRCAFMGKIQIFMSATMENMKPFIVERYYYPLMLRLPNDSCIKIYEAPSDYSYINLHYFNTQEEMKKIISSAADKKWLIFTDSIDAGKELRDELQEQLENEEEVGYIDANYAQDEDGQAIVEEIAEKILPKSVF